MIRELTCIGCPMGCQITVDVDGKLVTSVSGNKCLRGEKYARQECVAPERMVTSLAVIKNGRRPVSVKTLRPIPKEKVFECLNEIRSARPEPPLQIGDHIIENVAGTGVPVVVTSSCELAN